MTYAEAMSFWFGRANYEQKTPQADDLKLDRMRSLLARLGNPHDRLRLLHIAGSKGKGSTSAMLAAILVAAGYRTGLFTSPHLAAVEERIQVDGQPLTHTELAALLTEIRAVAAGSLERDLTFFEIGTALGLLHFVRRRTDFAVVEVGLGGRFDSTNVCRPLAALITTISLDHTQVLGDTLEAIAREKAGIIKPGRPTLSGVRAEGPRRVIVETCRQRGSPLRLLDRDFHYRYEPAVLDERDAVAHVQTWRRTWPDLRLNLIGEHQACNAALAVAAVELMSELGVPLAESAVRAGLATVSWPARLEVLGRRPVVVLDCAHNVASAEALVHALATSFPLRPGGRRWLVFAGSRDKDLAGMLRVLAPAFDRLVLTRFRDSPRATPPDQLAPLVPEQRCALVDNAVDAWHLAQSQAGPDDLICITGSVFLAGELRPLLLAELRSPPR